MTGLVTVAELERVIGRNWRTIRRWQLDHGFPLGVGAKGKVKHYDPVAVAKWLEEHPELAPRSTAKPPRRKRSADGPPARRAAAPAGNPGFRGYRYQALASLWLALHLLLELRACPLVQIEPKNDEDFEAALRDPMTASASVDAVADGMMLTVQVKLRTGAPWTAPAIADVLTGTLGRGVGTRARKRPLQMLRDDRARHYLIVTNEALEAGLRAHQALSPFDFPDDLDDLPQYSREGIGAEERRELSRRFAILAEMKEEILHKRIDDILALHGHVPQSRRTDCRDRLLEAVFARICGEDGGVLRSEDVMATVVLHQGSALPRRRLDHYVEPRSLAEIRRRLDSQHAVIIGGASGIGKTLTADMLEHELVTGTPPFEVRTEAGGPNKVRESLGRPGPHLFHLRDPWGGNRLEPEADDWSDELPKIIEERSPDRKFIVTSRSDILGLARVDKTLRRFVVDIEPEDYGPERMARIYDNLASDFEGPVRSLAKRFRSAALASFQRPYEIDRFLITLLDEDPQKPRSVSQIIHDAQIESISGVVAKQVAAHPAGTAAAAILWALLRARTAVPRTVLSRVLRRFGRIQGVRPNVEGLVSFLEAGGNLRRRDSIELAHPRVGEGLAQALERDPGTAEDALGRLLETLFDLDAHEGGDWGSETALSILRGISRLQGIEPDFDREPLDRYLYARLVRSGGAHRTAALHDLADLGSERSASARAARLLLQPEGKGGFGGFRIWKRPEVDAAEIERLRSDPSTPGLIEAFVASLAFSTMGYTEETVDFLFELGADGRMFMETLRGALKRGGPAHNVAELAIGACRAEPEGFEATVEMLAADEEEAIRWLETIREDLLRARNFEMDGAAAERMSEEPQERFHNSSEGRQAAVRWRIEQEGVAWLAGHPLRARLADAAAAAYAIGLEPPDGLLPVLLEHGSEAEADVWAMAARWRKEDLRAPLAAALARGGMSRRLRDSLAEALATIAGDHAELLARVRSTAGPERRIELAVDLLRAARRKRGLATRGTDFEPIASEWLEMLTDGERRLAEAVHSIRNGHEIVETAQGVGDGAAAVADELMALPPASLGGELACIMAARGRPVGDLVARLLDGEDEEAAVAAVTALAIAGEKAPRELLWKAFEHVDHDVRRMALDVLAASAETDERPRIIGAAADPGAYVRLEFARLMRRERWPEAEAALARRLGDDRDFRDESAHLGQRWPRHQIAREAAHALALYDVKSGETVDALLASAASAEDPFAACASLSALARVEDERAAMRLRAAFDDPGLDDDDRYRPRGIAAAWAFFDRTVSGIRLSAADRYVLARATSDPLPRIAGPAILALAFASVHEAACLAPVPEGAGRERRRELAFVAAAVAGAPQSPSDGPDQLLLAALGRGEPVDEKSPRVKALRSWLSTLERTDDVAFVTIWMVSLILGEDLADELELRAYDLPHQIPVMSLRALTGAGERLDQTDLGV